MILSMLNLNFPHNLGLINKKLSMRLSLLRFPTKRPQVFWPSKEKIQEDKLNVVSN